MMASSPWPTTINWKLAVNSGRKESSTPLGTTTISDSTIDEIAGGGGIANAGTMTIVQAHTIIRQRVPRRRHQRRRHLQRLTMTMVNDTISGNRR